jgi:hypothetical protein
MAVTLHARETRGLGTIQPGRSVRYSEECTSRTWTVTGVPRQAPKAGDSGPPTTQEPTPGTPGPNNASLHPVSVQVEVRPGHVARVVL